MFTTYTHFFSSVALYQPHGCPDLQMADRKSGDDTDDEPPSDAKQTEVQEIDMGVEGVVDGKAVKKVQQESKLNLSQSCNKLEEADDGEKYSGNQGDKDGEPHEVVPGESVIVAPSVHANNLGPPESVEGQGDAPEQSRNLSHQDKKDDKDGDEADGDVGGGGGRD